MCPGHPKRFGIGHFKQTFDPQVVLWKVCVAKVKAALILTSLTKDVEVVTSLSYETRGDKGTHSACFYVHITVPCSENVICTHLVHFLVCNKKSRFDFADELKVGDVRYKHLI